VTEREEEKAKEEPTKGEAKEGGSMQVERPDVA
jgi:hypothetical protein